jgi:hypothetical protein
MTPTEIETMARDAYNAVGDKFWSQSEIFNLIYAAMMGLVEKGLVIERTFSASTVASQQEYDYPTNAIAIKRVEYDGAKLQHIDQREDDAITLNDAATTNEGTPYYYQTWNEVIILRPIPDSVGTLKIRAYVEPTVPTVSSTLEVPTQHHLKIVDFVVREMVAKDQNWNAYDRYDARWQEHLQTVMRWAAKKKRGDKFAVVKNVDTLTESLLGTP